MLVCRENVEISKALFCLESHQLTSGDGEEDTYEVWHLTPDTSYIFSLQLERPGVGGRGEEGPESEVTTTCMSPTTRVTTITVLPTPLDDPHILVVAWQVSLLVAFLFSLSLSLRADSIAAFRSSRSRFQL